MAGKVRGPDTSFLSALGGAKAYSSPEEPVGSTSMGYANSAAALCPACSRRHLWWFPGVLADELLLSLEPLLNMTLNR